MPTGQGHAPRHVIFRYGQTVAETVSAPPTSAPGRDTMPTRSRQTHDTLSYFTLASSSSRSGTRSRGFVPRDPRCRGGIHRPGGRRGPVSARAYEPLEAPSTRPMRCIRAARPLRPRRASQPRDPLPRQAGSAAAVRRAPTRRRPRARQGRASLARRRAGSGAADTARLRHPYRGAARVSGPLSERAIRSARGPLGRLACVILCSKFPVVS